MLNSKKLEDGGRGSTKSNLNLKRCLGNAKQILLHSDYQMKHLSEWMVNQPVFHAHRQCSVFALPEGPECYTDECFVGSSDHLSPPQQMPFSETSFQGTSWKAISAWKWPHCHHLNDWWGPPDFLLPDGYVAGCGSLLHSLFVLDELASLVFCLLPPFLKSSSSPQVGMGLMSYHHDLYPKRI